MRTIDALRTVDDALTSGRARSSDPEERELQEIALALRADTPAPDPAFAARLDGRVARRFSQERPARNRLPRRRLLLAGAAGLLVVVAVGGAVAGLSGRDENPSIQSARPAVTEAPRGGTAALDLGAPAPRRVERDAQLTLAAPADRLGRVADRIVEVTDRHRGVVLDSSVSSGDDPVRGGSFSLRVPTSQLTGTLRDLSRLGEVRSRTESGHDVTRAYASLADRLTSARVERRGLLRRLGHATSTAEADRLRSRLDSLAQEIHELRSELGSLRARSDNARVSVTLVEEHRTGAVGGAGDALRGSLRALVGGLAVTLRVLAAVLPFALLGALAWAATIAVRRRRREAILS